MLLIDQLRYSTFHVRYGNWWFPRQCAEVLTLLTPSMELLGIKTDRESLLILTVGILMMLVGATKLAGVW